MLLHHLNRRTSRTAILLAAAASAVASSAHALPINAWIGSGTDVWNFAGNWNNGNIPNSTEQATIFSGPTTLYQAPASIGALQISKLGSAGQVFTNGFKLNVLGSVNIDGTNAGLYAYNAPAGSVSVQAPAINLTNGGILVGQLSGSKIRVASNASGTPNGTLTVDGTSTVYAGGTLDVSAYINNGTLYNNADGSTINATTFTFAGTAAHVATIDAQFEALTINANTLKLHDAETKIDVSDFGGNLTLNGDTDLASGNIGADVYVGDSAQLNLNGGTYQFGYYSKQGAVFVPNGSVNLNGGSTLAKAAKINSYATYFTDVNVTGYGNMASAEFDGGANVNVAGNSFLYVKDAYFRGTTFSQQIAMGGTGITHMNGGTGIGFSSPGIAYTVVNVGAGGIFDLDGTSESAATLNIENGELNINAAAIDEQTYFNGVPINHFGYDGTINIANDSKLNVAGTAWTLFGTMELQRGAVVQGQTLTVDGSYLAPGANSLHLTGSLGVVPTIQAPVVFKNDAYVLMENGGGLNLNGATDYAGGYLTSAPFGNPGQPYGIMTQNAPATVSATSTVFCNTYDLDGAANTITWVVNAGATFHQLAWNIDGPNSTNNLFRSTMTLNGGTIDMETNLGFWTLADGTLNMNQVGLSIPFVTHDKLVLGNGATKGTVNVGDNTIAFISGGLRSANVSPAGGNVINVGANSQLYIGGNVSSENFSTMTKTGPGALTVNVSQNYGTSSTIFVVGGSLNLNTNAGGSGPTLSVIANTAGTANFGASQQLDKLIVSGGGKVNVLQQANYNSRLTIASTLSFTGGLVDLTANDMIARNSNSPVTIRAALAQGYNGGAWNGTAGLTSSAAAASGKTGIGYLLNNDGNNNKLFTAFNGQNVNLNDVLIKYTFRGDSNLDGVVDFTDLVALAQNYNGVNTLWNKGDFNYDGTTDFNDLVPLAQNYNGVLSLEQEGQLAMAGGSALAADFALAQSLVPEPTTLALLGLALPVMARRRTTR